MTLTVLAAATLAVWWYRRRRGGPAGASADARARRLRTPLIRLAELAGISTARGRLAARSQTGAAGEQATARILDPLRAQGWTVLHDRALPTGNANLDHLVVSPSGVVFVIDSKLWSSRSPIRVDRGRLLHGDRDVTGRLRGLRHEAATVARVLGCPVVTVIAMHGAPVERQEQQIADVRILPADRLPVVLRAAARRYTAAGQHPGARVSDLFPKYGRN